MNTEINSYFEELHALAQERGWSKTAQSADALLSSTRSADVLLTAPSEVDTTALRHWIANALPSETIRVESLRTLQHDPLPALQSDRLVILLECGRLMDAEEVDIVAGLVSMRPENTFGYALTRANRITSEEDLDLVQRGFWRLLVPEPKPEWNGQDIRAHHAYLWSAEPPNGMIEVRTGQDQQALVDWLHAPGCATQELKKKQIFYLLNLAQEEAEAQIPSPPEPTGVEEYAVRNALDSVIELRRRFNRHLDADAFAVESELTVSLQTLEQNLLVDLSRHLRKHIEELHGDLDGQRLRTILSEYIRQGAERWQQQTQETLTARGREITSDVQLLSQGINWPLISTIAQKSGSTQTFPDSLLHTLADSREFQSLQRSSIGTPDVSQYHAPAGFGATLRIAAAGSIAGGIALFLLGLGPIGIISAGAAGALGGGAIHRHLQKKISQQEAEAVSRQAITNVLREAVAQVRQQTKETFTPIRDRFNKEMTFLEDVLEHTIQEARRAANEPVNPDLTLAHAAVADISDLAQLRALRGRLLRADDQASTP